MYQTNITHVTTLPYRGRVGPPPNKGGGNDVARPTPPQKTPKLPNPPPVGKAGFEV
jgi:hypothetical protein